MSEQDKLKLEIVEIDYPNSQGMHGHGCIDLKVKNNTNLPNVELLNKLGRCTLASMLEDYVRSLDKSGFEFNEWKDAYFFDTNKEDGQCTGECDNCPMDKQRLNCSTRCKYNEDNEEFFCVCCGCDKDIVSKAFDDNDNPLGGCIFVFVDDADNELEIYHDVEDLSEYGEDDFVN
jgi:hypothetical protein